MSFFDEDPMREFGDDTSDTGLDEKLIDDIANIVLRKSNVESVALLARAIEHYRRCVSESECDFDDVENWTAEEHQRFGMGFGTAFNIFVPQVLRASSDAIQEATDLGATMRDIRRLPDGE